MTDSAENEARLEFDARSFDMSERIAATHIIEALAGRSAAKRARILRWAFERFVPPHQRRPGDPVPSVALTPTERAALAAAIERDEDAGVSDHSIEAVEHILATRVIPPGQDDDCACGHDHGVSTTTCDRCYWCQQESRPIPPAKGD